MKKIAVIITEPTTTTDYEGVPTCEWYPVVTVNALVIPLLGDSTQKDYGVAGKEEYQLIIKGKCTALVVGNRCEFNNIICNITAVANYGKAVEARIKRLTI